MERTVTCTLTLVNDHTGSYSDDLQYQEYLGKTQEDALGTSRLVRLVVGLLNRWVDDYQEQCRRDELKVLGRALYAIAFGGESQTEKSKLGTAFESTLDECRSHGHRVRLRLVFMPDAATLSTYPWEFMYRAKGEGDDGYFLAGQNTALSLTRYVPNQDTWPDSSDPAGDGRLRLLVVESTPSIPGMTRLRVGDFVKHLVKLDPERFDPLVLSSPDRAELRRAVLEHRPHVIHFIGHGRPGALALKKDDQQILEEREYNEATRAPGQAPVVVDEADWVDSATTRELLRQGLDDLPAAPPRLVFLHACESDKPEENRNNLTGMGSVARDLALSDRISGVIAMQYTIGVEDAEIFADAFYASIADSRPVDEAVTTARKALAEQPRPGRSQVWNDRGFGTPVIYLRRSDALVPARAPRDSGSESVTVAKEPCPNPNCLQGSVLRDRQTYCKACKEPFIVCPNPKCRTGLVVAKPGAECRDCDYVVPTTGAPQAAPSAVGTRHAPEPSASRSAAPGDAFSLPRPSPDGPGYQQPTSGDLGWGGT